jgi:phosphohistidine phosphatase
MELIILRHGKAEDQHPNGDFSRALVDKGYAQARAAGIFLKSAGLLPEVVLTSPLVRARQTAEEFCKAAEIPGPVISGWLACGMSPSSAIKNLAEFRDFKRIAIVGHEPDLSDLITYSLGIGENAVEVKKGSLACLRIEPPHPAGELAFLIPPKLNPHR